MEELTKDNYFEYKKDSMGTPVLSSSFLKNACPIKSGNPDRLEAYFQGLMEKPDSQALRFGQLVHQFAEDRTRFVFEPEWEMSETIRTIADKLHKLLTDTGIRHRDSPSSHAREFEIICDELGWGQKWKAETRMSKFIDAAHLYWMFMNESQGKIIVTGDQVEQMAGVIKGIEAAGLRVPLLDDRKEEGVETFREKAISFTLFGAYPAKILLDNMEIDHNEKVITITDLKTTSFPIERFITGYMYRPDENGIVKKVETMGDYVKYMYYFQEYFYRLGVKEHVKDTALEEYTIKFQFGVVETSAPFQAKMIKPNSQWMAIAFDEFEVAMDTVKEWMSKYNYLTF